MATAAHETSELWLKLDSAARALVRSLPSNENRSFESLIDVERKLEGCISALACLKNNLRSTDRFLPFPSIDRGESVSPFPSGSPFSFGSSKMENLSVDSPARTPIQFSRSSENTQPPPSFRETPRKRIRSELDETPSTLSLPPLSFVRESNSTTGHTSLPPLRQIFETNCSSPQHESLLRRHFSATHNRLSAENQFDLQTSSLLSARSPLATQKESLSHTTPSLGAEFKSLHPGIVRPPSQEERPFPRGIRCCELCRTSDTPEWRKGPNGPKTLCNACGLKFAKVQRDEDTAERKEERLEKAASLLQSAISSTTPH